MDLQLKRLRKERGYKTQSALASVLDVPERRYASWERGEVMMSLEQACQISNVLGCTLDELAGRTPPPAIEDPRLERIERAYRGMNETGRDALETSARALHALPENAGKVVPWKRIRHEA